MDCREILRRYYGYSSFRKGQEEIIASALEKRDSLVLMPTGGGKSLCFQIPALAMPGCAIVVSPLIALMNDQVAALKANGISAEAVHSNQDETVNRDNLYRASIGDVKLLYISPERLTAEFERIRGHIPVSLVAIDEAHCISQWGHDFRPVYTSLSVIKEAMPDVPVMALTATADRLTRADIAGALGLRDPFVWVGSFDRPNLSLTVLADPGKKQRLRVIEAFVRKYRLDSGIVYCLSRKKTEDMHKALLDMGIKSVCYHAGLSPADREAAQKAFVNGEAQVVCATIAFGMGIDKSNIRWVVHNNLPGNIESYYQEIGRAGRDGMPAETLMFYNYGDVIMRRNFVEDSGQREINGEKLDFMQRYAEASVCRRRILLSYFSEETVTDCGNCDNCRNPRKRFDGTILAQKALSAVIRINAREAMNTVIDILRASNRADIIRKGYHQIKTYGAGRDLGAREWHNYLLQMVQLGLFEVAYDDNLHLRPTPLGMKVVKGLQRVELATFEPQEPWMNKRKASEMKDPVRQLSPEERLMERLKRVRMEIAKKENIAPYMVFADTSLDDMVRKRPLDIDAFREINGAGVLKTVKYGKSFISIIRKFETGKAGMPAGTSQKETLMLFEAGMEADQIAAIKDVSVATVYSHLAQWAEEGKEIDFRRLVTVEELDTVCSVFSKDPDNAYEILKTRYSIPNHIIRIARLEASI